jgi:acetate kinase
MDDCILTINVGSATLKFALFQKNKDLTKICSGDLNNRSRTLSIFDKDSNKPIQRKVIEGKHSLLQPKYLFKWIKHNYPNVNIKIIGHRLVHGGKVFLQPTLITKPVLSQLKKLIPLAPLHMPHEVGFVEKILLEFPKILQAACFDTSFHRVQPRLATLFAIPRKYTEEDGIIRYGFHGLSYEYIAEKLSQYTNKTKLKKVIVAHLGNGASLCAMHKNKSVATSMGFSALDGLIMGTRCGNIDPGVLLYLMQEKGLSVKELERILYKESGLLGVSGITNDMKELIESKDPKAKEAVDLFCYRAIREIGSLVATLEGLDVLVFTGGIGEHAAVIRDKICEHLGWLGMTIDFSKNKCNSLSITAPTSRVEVHVIPTNEEFMIAKHVYGLIK